MGKLRDLVETAWKIETDDIQDERMQKFLLQDREDRLTLVATPTFSEEDKEAMLDAVAKLINKIGALRYVAVAEAWMSVMTPSHLPGLPPSKQPNRQDALIAIGVDREGGSCFFSAEITTDKDGKRHLGEVNKVDSDHQEGRMAELFKRADRLAGREFARAE